MSENKSSNQIILLIIILAIIGGPAFLYRLGDALSSLLWVAVIIAVVYMGYALMLDHLSSILGFFIYVSLVIVFFGAFWLAAPYLTKAVVFFTKAIFNESNIESSVKKPANDYLQKKPLFYSPPKHFYVGAEKWVVREVMGDPTEDHGNAWHYGRDIVAFDSLGYVVGYDNQSGNLRIGGWSVVDVEAVLTRGSFEIGSSKSDLIIIQGPPDSIIGDTWSYGPDTVTFDDNGKVMRFVNNTGKLKVK